MAEHTIGHGGLNFSRFRQESYGSAIQFVQEIGPCTIFRGEVHHKSLISSFIPNNKIKSSDKVQCNVKHTRTIIHFPDRFLAVIEHLKSPESHDYIQWNHISPHLLIRKYTDKKVGIHNNNEESVCIIMTNDSEDNPLNIIEVEGQSHPHLQGWISRDGRELVPNPALGFSNFGDNKNFVTVFDFKMQNTGDPYLRIGSNGKYQRFAIKQDGLKVDFKIRELEDKNISIEAIIDNIEYPIVTVSISS